MQYSKRNNHNKINNLSWALEFFTKKIALQVNSYIMIVQICVSKYPAGLALMLELSHRIATILCIFKNFTNDFSSEFSLYLRGMFKLTSSLLWYDMELHHTQYKTKFCLDTFLKLIN